MLFRIQGIQRRGDGKDCAPLPPKERGARWACLAILGLGEVCTWGRLEPAIGGNRRRGFRLVSPAEGASTLALAHFSNHCMLLARMDRHTYSAPRPHYHHPPTHHTTPHHTTPHHATPRHATPRHATPTTPTTTTTPHPSSLPPTHTPTHHPTHTARDVGHHGRYGPDGQLRHGAHVQTAQTVESPQLQSIQVVDISFRGAADVSHGPDRSSDHRHSPVAVHGYRRPCCAGPAGSLPRRGAEAGSMVQTVRLNMDTPQLLNTVADVPVVRSCSSRVQTWRRQLRSHSCSSLSSRQCCCMPVGCNDRCWVVQSAENCKGLAVAVL